MHQVAFDGGIIRGHAYGIIDVKEHKDLRFLQVWSHNDSVSVCVCQRERERGRESEAERVRQRERGG